MKYLICLFLFIFTSSASSHHVWEDKAKVLNLKNGVIKFEGERKGQLSSDGQWTGEIEAEKAIFESEDGNVLQFTGNVKITVDENGEAQVKADIIKFLKSWEESAKVLNLKNGVIKFDGERKGQLSSDGQWTGEIEAKKAIFESEDGRAMQFTGDVKITVDENGVAQIKADSSKVLK